MKKLFAILICLMLVFFSLVLASCGDTGSDTGSSSESSKAANEDADVTESGSNDNKNEEDTDNSSEGENSAIDSASGTDSSSDNGADSSVTDSSVPDSEKDDGTNDSADNSTSGSGDDGNGDDEKPKTVIVQFKGNGSADVVFEGNSIAGIERGTSIDLYLIPTVARPGYTFRYWSYDPTGNSQWTPSDIIESDTILYANWKADIAEGEGVTITFTCMSGTYQSGDKEIKINTGSGISKVQMPVYTRNGYVIKWSYDRFGEEPWCAADTFESDTELFATWIKEDKHFEVINAYLYSVGSMQINGTLTFGGYDGAVTSVEKYNGEEIYSYVSTSNVEEEYWYVDGFFYASYGGEKYKTKLTPDEFSLIMNIKPFSAESIFGIAKDSVTSSTKDGQTYAFVVDAEKYTENAAGSLEYTKFIMNITFGDDGEISKVIIEYTYERDGEGAVNCVSVSEIVNVNQTVVAPPSDADQYATK